MARHWTTMLKYLKVVWPIISRQAFSNEGGDREILHPFLFVDCNKGLKLARRCVFPRNKETSCAKHIEAKSRVCQKFGQEFIQILKSLD